MNKTHSARARSVSTIHRERRPGLDLSIVERGKIRELHITLLPTPHQRPAQMLWRLDGLLREHEASVVKHDVFGSLEIRPRLLKSMQCFFGTRDWPVTWVEGHAPIGSSALAMNVFAISGAAVHTLYEDGRPIGRCFDDGTGRHCLLGELRPPNTAEPKPGQAWKLVQTLENALGQAGLTLSHLLRTWLFLDEIHSWYGAFNEVRTEIFTQKTLFPHGVPASTGVGMRNPFGAALVASAWAVRPRARAAQIQPVQSPLQCEASSYGSRFSRAIEIVSSTHRRLLISGTASIGRDGRTISSGDAYGQINLTMQVIDAILAVRQLGFSQIARGIAYFKNPLDAPLFESWCAERRMTFPVVLAVAEICREELLFEIEVDAIGQLAS